MQLAAFKPLIIIGLVALSGAPAAAQSCAAEIDRLAQQYNLASGAPQSGGSEAPRAVPSAPASSAETRTQRLAQAGGVVSPPDTGTPLEIRPPHSNPDHMSTHSAPSPPPGSGSSTGGLGAADRTRMQAFLQAAQDAERQGKEEQCLQHLREAEAVPGVPSAK